MEEHPSDGAPDERYGGAHHYEQLAHGSVHPEGGGKIRSSLKRLFGRRKGSESATEEWYWEPELPTAQSPLPGWTLLTPTQESLQRAEAQGFVTSETYQQPVTYPPSTFRDLPRPEPELGPKPQQAAAPLPQASVTPVPEQYESSPAATEQSQEDSPGWGEGPDLPEWILSEYEQAPVAATAHTPPVSQPLPELSRPLPESEEATLSTPPEAADEPARDVGKYTILEHSTEPIGGYLEELEVAGRQEPVEVDHPPP